MTNQLVTRGVTHFRLLESVHSPMHADGVTVDACQSLPHFLTMCRARLQQSCIAFSRTWARPLVLLVFVAHCQNVICLSPACAQLGKASRTEGLNSQHCQLNCDHVAHCCIASDNLSALAIIHIAKLPMLSLHYTLTLAPDCLILHCSRLHTTMLAE